jgi:hypothetical protein
MGMVESLLKLAGLSWRVPDYSKVCRRQKTLKVPAILNLDRGTRRASPGSRTDGPNHAVLPARDGARGITASGVWGSAPFA